MPSTKQITKAKFLEWYAKDGIRDVFTIEVSGEQRVYGKTSFEEAENPDKYVVVFCAV